MMTAVDSWSDISIIICILRLISVTNISWFRWRRTKILSSKVRIEEFCHRQRQTDRQIHYHLVGSERVGAKNSQKILTWRVVWCFLHFSPFHDILRCFQKTNLGRRKGCVILQFFIAFLTISWHSEVFPKKYF